MESVDSTRVIEMISSLRHASDALQTFGVGTRSAQKIRKTLVKLVQFCMSLGRFDTNYAPAVISAWPTRENAEMFQNEKRNQHGVGFPPQMENAVHFNVSDTDNLPLMPQPDPFAGVDVDIRPYWPENDMNLFNELDGMDSGLTALMAG